MPTPKRYPKIGLLNKYDLAKQIAGKNLSRTKALELINDTLKNFNKYWHDSTESEPAKGKFVRSAAGKPLGKLLKLIDKKVLAPFDYLVPDFIFGGVSKKSHVLAARHLIGVRRKRILLGLDLHHFFEQIEQQRVFYFFNKRCGCSVKASRLLANLLCVEMGPKGDPSKQIVLARGFATSPRLALWCNLDLFLRAQWKAKKMLKGKNPRIAIFVDDIGITASEVNAPTMALLAKEIEKVFEHFDPNQKLRLNLEKTKIMPFAEGAEHLGLRLGKKLTIGRKTRARRDYVANQLKTAVPGIERTRLAQQRKAYRKYEAYIKKLNKA